MKFNVPEMSCGHCTAAITKEIEAIDPGADVTTNLEDHTVTVETTQSADAITQAIKSAGYESTAV